MRQHLAPTTITLGYSDLFGGKTTWELFEQRLRKFPLWEVVDIISRNSILLKKAEDPSDQKMQAQLCSLLFGKAADDVWRRFMMASRQHSSQPYVLFYEQLHVNFFKAAFHLLDVEPVSHTRSSDYGDLGHALLMLSDLIQNDRKRSREEFAIYLLTNHHAHKRHRTDHEFARAFELYLTDCESLRSHPDYLDLPKLAEEATGLSPEGIAVGLWSLMAEFELKSLEATIQQPTIAISRHRHFSNSGFSESEIDRIFGLLTINALELKSKIKQESLYKPFDYYPINDFPLVRFGEHVYCMSLPAFTWKSSEGFRSMFLQPGIPKDVREKFLRYSGPLFQDYVGRLLRRAVSRNPKNLLELDLIPRKTPGKIADFLLRSKKDLVIIEAKASRLSAKALANEDLHAVTERLGEIHLESARQIDNTVKAVEAGEFQSMGFGPDNVRNYYPLVVSLESNSMNWSLTPAIWEAARKEGVLTNSKVKPHQNMDVSELEILEEIIASGRLVSGMLSRKTSSEQKATLSFTNYWYFNDRETFLLRNAWLMSRFDAINRQMEQWIIDRNPGLKPDR